MVKNMFVKKLSGAIAILGLALFLVLALSANNVKVKGSYPLNSLWVDPAEVNFDTNNATSGTQFNVTAWAYMQNNTYGWQVRMEFDPTLLQVVAAGYTGASGSQFFSGHATSPVPAVLDNVLGYVMIGESLQSTDFGLEKTASLMWAEFEVEVVPNATVPSLTGVLNINVTDTYFLDVDLNTMTTTSFNGAYSITYATPLPLAIPSVTQDPVSSNVGDSESVAVSANVTGGDGGVKNVTLSYSTDNSTFSDVAMTLNGATGLWDGTVPGYTSGTKVYYKITAYDNAGNSVVSDTGQWYYTVIPEFSSVLTIVMLLAMSSAVLLMRKKIVRK